MFLISTILESSELFWNLNLKVLMILCEKCKPHNSLSISHNKKNINFHKYYGNGKKKKLISQPHNIFLTVKKSTLTITFTKQYVPTDNYHFSLIFLFFNGKNNLTLSWAAAGCLLLRLKLKIKLKHTNLIWNWMKMRNYISFHTFYYIQKLCNLV